jgi:hypothetical protein
VERESKSLGNGREADDRPVRDQVREEKKEGNSRVAFRVRLSVKWSTRSGNHLSCGTPDGELSKGMSLGRTLRFTILRTRRR